MISNQAHQQFRTIHLWGISLMLLEMQGSCANDKDPVRWCRPWEKEQDSSLVDGSPSWSSFSLYLHSFFPHHASSLPHSSIDLDNLSHFSTNLLNLFLHSHMTGRRWWGLAKQLQVRFVFGALFNLRPIRQSFKTAAVCARFIKKRLNGVLGSGAVVVSLP